MGDPAADPHYRLFGQRLDRFLVTLFVGLVLAGGLLWVVGLSPITDQLDDVTLAEGGRLLVVAMLPLIVWGLGLHVLLTGLGVTVTRVRSVALTIAAGFLNNITPFGQVGGDPPSALLIGHLTHSPVEIGLAGITSLNLINRLAAVILGVIGILVLIAPFSPAEGLGVQDAVGLAASGIVFSLLAWLYVRRSAVVIIISPLLSTISKWGARLLPGITQPSDVAVRARIEGFVRAIEQLVADPGRLIVVLSLGLVGEILVAFILYLSLLTLDAPVPFAIVIVVLPAAKISGLSPTPGGVGSAVAVLAGLLAATTGLPLSTTTSVALLYRTVAYWVPTALGCVLAVGMVTMSDQSDG